MCAAAAGAADAQAPAPGQGSTRPRLPTDPPNASAAAPGRLQEHLPVFAFHSNLWLNLHHFLYHQARARSAPPDLPRAWQDALDYYARELAGRDLLFNSDMVNIKNRLVELEGCAELSGRSGPQCVLGLRPELAEALERAAPLYRERWWAEHDRQNRAWVGAMSPLVEQLGGVLAEQLAQAYRQDWPAGRIRVDVAYYANGAGAYTTLHPVHILVGSSAEANQGPAGLEILFHEASHALAEGVREGIARECRARNKPIPRDLWHALLFYTTGEVVRRAFGGAGGAASLPDPSEYTPYAFRQGLYRRGWEKYLKVLERHWQPYLEGRSDFDDALARVVAEL